MHLEDVAASGFRGKAASQQMSGQGWEAAEKGRAGDLSWEWSPRRFWGRGALHDL